MSVSVSMSVSLSSMRSQYDRFASVRRAKSGGPGPGSGLEPARQRAAPALVLTAALLGFFVITLDALAVNVALSDIGHNLSGGMAGLQWVMDGYTLMFAALMLSAGALSDRIGASRAYGIGLVLFTLSSAGCGLAPGLGALIAARIVQGAAAALMLPASLALIRQAYPEAGRRARAIALWSAGGAVAAAAGPVVGGVLTGLWGWRAIFFVNLPVGAVALAMLARVPRSTPRPAPLDPVGQITGVVALAALTYAVIEGGAVGFGSTRVAAVLALAVGAAALFLGSQARAAEPMLPLGLFRQRVVSVSVAIGFALNVAFYGTVFLFGLYLQRERGQSTAHTGLLFVPMTGLLAVLNLGAAGVARRFGPRLPILTGQLIVVAGLFGLLAVGADTPLWLVALLLVPIGLGSALTVPPLTAMLLDSVAAERAGTAAAILNTSRQLGGALSVAAFGALIARHASFQVGMRQCVMVAIVLLAGTAAATLLLPSRRPGSAETGAGRGAIGQVVRSADSVPVSAPVQVSAGPGSAAAPAAGRGIGERRPEPCATTAR
ncbi:MFS transporter [Embleya sp. AB8]|uniref:MFS transporter n=1 Tax=Embleya sp. AB8 TaxID=3156304 RepID=UPI003C75B489